MPRRRRLYRAGPRRRPSRPRLRRRLPRPRPSSRPSRPRPRRRPPRPRPRSRPARPRLRSRPPRPRPRRRPSRPRPLRRPPRPRPRSRPARPRLRSRPSRPRLRRRPPRPRPRRRMRVAVRWLGWPRLRLANARCVQRHHRTALTRAFALLRRRVGGVRSPSRAPPGNPRPTPTNTVRAGPQIVRRPTLNYTPHAASVRRIADRRSPPPNLSAF
jgi:hypothetical protein